MREREFDAYLRKPELEVALARRDAELTRLRAPSASDATQPEVEAEAAVEVRAASLLAANRAHAEAQVSASERALAAARQDARKTLSARRQEELAAARGAAATAILAQVRALRTAETRVRLNGEFALRTPVDAVVAWVGAKGEKSDEFSIGTKAAIWIATPDGAGMIFLTGFTAVAEGEDLAAVLLDP